MASYRRTNEPRPLEVEPSIAGATGGGDHGMTPEEAENFYEDDEDPQKIFELFEKTHEVFRCQCPYRPAESWYVEAHDQDKLVILVGCQVHVEAIAEQMRSAGFADILVREE